MRAANNARSFYQDQSARWRQCRWDHRDAPHGGRCSSSPDGNTCDISNLDGPNCRCDATCPRQLGVEAGAHAGCSEQGATTSNACARYFYRTTGAVVTWRQCGWNPGETGKRRCEAAGKYCVKGDCDCPAKCQSHVLPGECEDKGKNTCETCAHILRNV